MVFYCGLMPVLLECSSVFPSVVMIGYPWHPSGVRGFAPKVGFAYALSDFYTLKPSILRSNLTFEAKLA
jgi:hypothetical protein